MSAHGSVGVDGCKGGWFAVCLGPEQELEFGFFERLDELWRRYADAALTLVDIPIGLASASMPQRACDRQARRILSPYRQASVFSPPCREALSASTFEEASRIHRQITDRGLSVQSWNIIHKIREMDAFLRTRPEAVGRIRESHPEVCFWALAGGSPMRKPKRSRQGRQERLEVLKRFQPQAETLAKAAAERCRSSEVARDDILDALALAVAARASADSPNVLPETPDCDEAGLPMEIVHPQPIPRPVTFLPIGTVQTGAVQLPRHWSVSEVEGILNILPEYAEGLSDIEPGQRIVVLFYFDRSSPFEPGLLRQTPPHRDRPMGVFSICSPRRPNAIGLSVLHVVEKKENRIRVRGLDMFDGTPILDIKPHYE